MKGVNLFDWKTWISGMAARSAGGPGWFGYRDYVAGDDLRAIDWALCARHDELRVRQSTGPVDTRLYFLFDCSRSMAFGTPSKFDAGRQMVVELADAALTEGSQVRISAFANGLVADSEPARGKAAGDRLARFLTALRTERAPTDLARAAAGWVRRNQQCGAGCGGQRSVRTGRIPARGRHTPRPWLPGWHPSYLRPRRSHA